MMIIFSQIVRHMLTQKYNKNSTKNNDHLFHYFFSRSLRTNPIWFVFSLPQFLRFLARKKIQTLEKTFEYNHRRRTRGCNRCTCTPTFTKSPKIYDMGWKIPEIPRPRPVLVHLHYLEHFGASVYRGVLHLLTPKQSFEFLTN